MRRTSNIVACVARASSPFREVAQNGLEALATTLQALMVLSLLLVAGCNGRAADPRGVYIPPEETLSLSELIERINAANAEVASLFLQSGGAGGFEANLRESRDQAPRFVNGEMVALYMAPNMLRLRGTKPAVGEVFDLGTDGERFWMYLPTERLMYTGTFAGIDPELARQLPVRPDLVLQVMGFTPLESDLTLAPVPMLRVNPDADAYMLTYAEPVAGPPPRWVVVKEVWYDRKTLLPTLVVLFDEHGDPVLRAYLSRHLPIDGTGPRVATRYELYFPIQGSNMLLEFDAVHARNPQNRAFPNPRSFTPPDPAAVPDVRDLDRGAGQ